MADPVADSNILIPRAQQGDVEAFAQIFDKYRAMVYSVAFRLVGPNDCDDVVMDTYLKAWLGVGKFHRDSKTGTWLCRIAHNCAMDLIRKRNRRKAYWVQQEDSGQAPLVERVPDESLPTPREAAENSELGEAIVEALGQLSEDHRTAILLREVDGLSYREIASATGAHLGTVMSRLFHARRRLRKILEDSGQWES